MKVNILKVAGIITSFFIITCVNSFAQNTSPVRIEFDPDSKRIEIKTGKELPEYTHAQRGSIRFYLGRLDTPNDFVNYYHDGINKAYIKDLKSMEKVQEKFAIWRLRYKSGRKNTPRIHHLAVSFIPLSPATKKPEKRVFLLLNDLKLIEWGAGN
jgi:hypothetical protein